MFNLLRREIIYKYGSIKSFAASLGISDQTVSYKLHGKLKFKEGDVRTWSARLDLPLEKSEQFFGMKIST